MVEQSSKSSSTWKYAALGCGAFTLLIAAAIAGVLYFVQDLAKDSEVYQKASSEVVSNAEVQDALGTPIEPGGLSGGNFKTNNGSGYANFSFSVSGPRAEGDAAVRATQSAGQWTIEQLVVHVDGRESPISVIDKRRKSEAGAQNENSGGNSEGQPDALAQIAPGAAHICGLDSEKNVTCWGDDDSGKATAPPVKFDTLSAGMDHTCGLDASGKLRCWGDNKFGQIQVPDGDFVQVSAGFTHTCGIEKGGAVTCWGAGKQTGSTMFDEGQADAPDGSFATVAAGSFHSCAIDDDKHIQCWGDDEHGEASPPAGEFDALALGADHGCALGADGGVACWGDNAHGQTDAPDGAFVQITAGKHHTCARADDGRVTCWGANDDGQTDVPEGNFRSVAAQAAASCAIDEQGGWQCWGDDKANDQSDGSERGLYEGPTPQPRERQRRAAGPEPDPPPMYSASDVQDVSTIKAASIIRQHSGKPRLVVLWRTTCPPCRAMFPEVRKFAAECHQMGVEPLVFSTDGRRENLESYLSRGPVPFEPYRIKPWQSGEFDANLSRVGLEIGDSFGTPLVAVLDAHGNRVGQHEGGSGIRRARSWVRGLEGR